MPIELPRLPYSKDALAPYLSVETLEYHHDKHHRAYVDKVNALIVGTAHAAKSLETIVAESTGPLFQNAAQAWNHAFYWKSMTPDGGGAPKGAIAAAIDRDFGSFEAFRGKFQETAASHFGSGWAWLVLERGALAVTSTHDADLPLKHGRTPLIACDLWEHAYYVDYRNERAKYVTAFLDHLVNWAWAAKNLR